MRSLYLNHRFFYLLGGVAVLYIISFFVPFFGTVAQGAFILLAAVILLDIFLLYRKGWKAEGQRKLPEKLSNGDENKVQIQLKNNYPFLIHLKILEEAPFQFQLRNFSLQTQMRGASSQVLEYALSPVERGEYSFGHLNLYVQTPLGLAARRFTSGQGQTLPCYPSFVHLHEYELMAVQNEFLLGGIKKIRKIGHTLEFEQIREYVTGDDIRTINWKATGKRNQLMVNQYQEERAQRIYMVIDKGRVMKMPFQGLSLLDYSINAAMALSHIVLKKQDRAGMMTFSRDVENIVAAESKAGQLKKMADAFYNIDTDFAESDFNKLYIRLRHLLTRRSLIMLFTNFETLDGLKRQIKYLRAIAKNHLLVVVFFKNSELNQILEGKDHQNIAGVYDQVIAEKFEYEKKLIRQELRKHGIYSVYTLPEELSISTINKYLEIKARGLL